MAPALAAHPIRVEEPIVATCRVEKSIHLPWRSSEDVLVAPGSLAFGRETKHDCPQRGLRYTVSHNFLGENAAGC